MAGLCCRVRRCVVVSRVRRRHLLRVQKLRVKSVAGEMLAVGMHVAGTVIAMTVADAMNVVAEILVVATVTATTVDLVPSLLNRRYRRRMLRRPRMRWSRQASRRT